MIGMGVAAVGAYLKTLADVQRIKVADVSAAIDVQAKYLWRLEQEVIKEPSARILRLFTEALPGS